MTAGGDDRAALVAAIERAQRFLLVAHVNPDPDALGSALALGLALRGAGRDVTISFDAEPFAVPRALAWLPGADSVVGPAEAPDDADLVISLDCAAPDRLGRLLTLARSAPQFAVIDHHRSNPGFGGLNLVDAEAPATGQIVAELLAELGWPWDRDIATNLYAAISSDTGSFRYGSTTAATHQWAAALHQAGVDHADVARRLFSDRPLPVVRLAAEVLSAAVYEPSAAGGSGALIGVVSAADRARHDVPYDEVESLISDLAATGGVDVAAIVKEDAGGTWKVSTRSKGAIDLGRLASDFGGGGHLQAAGYTASGTESDEVVAALREALSRPEYRRSTP
jgi:bifunctional oligoribonuclease and PAP phosphatase NrnA